MKRRKIHFNTPEWVEMQHMNGVYCLIQEILEQMELLGYITPVWVGKEKKYVATGGS